MKTMTGLTKLLALLAAGLLLASCVMMQPLAPLSTIEEFSNDEGDMELLLEPLDVWDDQGAAAPEEMEVDGKKLYFRFRTADTFERAWVRMGLFWHSRQKNIHMPIVIAGGPPVTIRGVRVDADGFVETLQESKNFNFTPGKQPFDKELHSAAYQLSPALLGKIAAAKDVQVSIRTNRGSLRVNLSVITRRDSNSLAGSPKHQFAEFHRRVLARQ